MSEGFGATTKTKWFPMRDNNISENTDPERDIFADPALARQTSDPVAEFIKRQWRPLLVTVVLAFALVYVRDTFRESRQRGIEEGANALFESQEALKQLRESVKKVGQLKAKTVLADADKKELEAAEADLKTRTDRINQTLTILGESVAPYSGLANIIGGLAAHDRGELSAVENYLGKYPLETFDKLKGAPRLEAELGLITYARSLLDFPNSEQKARAILIALAQKGETVAVTAALTLLHIASTDQDKQQAQEIVNVLSAKFPEQASLLKE